MNIERIDIGNVRIDGGTQPRTEINLQLVEEYADALTEGDAFPQGVVFFDGACYWLADGFHRYHAAKRIAAKRIGADQLDAHVIEGTKRDAILHSVQANAEHGARRTNADKHKAVLTLLNDAEWAKWSDREIAKRCRVSANFVGTLRPHLSSDDRCERPVARKVTRGGKTYEQNTANIGRGKRTDHQRRIGKTTTRGVNILLINDPHGIASGLLSVFSIKMLAKMIPILQGMIESREGAQR